MYKIDKEKADKFIMDYFKMLKNNDKKSKEIISNTDYLKWLERFTTEHQSFTDDTWLYFSEKISKEDHEMVNSLHLLYRGIVQYAKKNYIYPVECEYGGYYRIKLDNIGYEIGMLIGQGSLFFCNRTELDSNLEYIDFNDIIGNKKKEHVDIISKELKDLSDKVLELYKKGIPLEALIEALETTLTRIKKEENNPTKTLKRN